MTFVSDFFWWFRRHFGFFDVQDIRFQWNDMKPRTARYSNMYTHAVDVVKTLHNLPTCIESKT